jgi:hypothetical protein
MGAAFLSTIAPIPTFAEIEDTEWFVQDLYNQCTHKGNLDEIFCLEFVSSVARQAFTNGLVLKHIKDPADLMTMSQNWPLRSAYHSTPAIHFAAAKLNGGR